MKLAYIRSLLEIAAQKVRLIYIVLQFLSSVGKIPFWICKNSILCFDLSVNFFTGFLLAIYLTAVMTLKRSKRCCILIADFCAKFVSKKLYLSRYVSVIFFVRISQVVTGNKVFLAMGASGH